MFSSFRSFGGEGVVGSFEILLHALDHVEKDPLLLLGNAREEAFFIFGDLGLNGVVQTDGLFGEKN